MNILYGRKIEAMSPVQSIFKDSMRIIRPFFYTDESLIKLYAKKAEFPIIQKLCPADGKTKRQRIKYMIRELEREEKNANIRENIFKSLYHVNMNFTKPVGKNRL